jgi:hypothetical protein
MTDALNITNQDSKLCAHAPKAFLFSTIRDDLLGDLHANGEITDEQLLAGRRFQALYLQCEYASRALGPVGERLLRDILIDGLSVADVAKRHRDNGGCAVAGPPSCITS